MQTVTVQRTIAAPIEDVFDWLSDSSNYTASPLVLSERVARPGQGARYGRGAIREITTVLAFFREEITAYDRPHEFRYLIRKALPPLRHHGGRIALREAPAGTEVTWTSTFALPVPVAGSVLERLVAPVVALAFGSLLDTAARTVTSPAVDDTAVQTSADRLRR